MSSKLNESTGVRKPAIAMGLLNSIAAVAGRRLKRKNNSPRELVNDLDTIVCLIRLNQCTCGRWQRGGNRQGAYLCQQCYTNVD